MICVDASVVVRLVVLGEASRAVTALWRGWLDAEEDLVAPDLLHYEVTNALHRYVAAGALSESDADAALDAALGLGVRLLPGARLHGRAFDIARRLHQPATYDAHYLAAAVQHDAALWTADRRLHTAARKVFDRVHLVG
jgi:predicted nucleic acid-binding protein